VGPREQWLVKDIREADRRADVVIVFPHWGVEYFAPPTQAARQGCALGYPALTSCSAHSRVAGAIESSAACPSSLCSATSSTRMATFTMESFLLEATFATPDWSSPAAPYLTHDQAQPNLPIQPRAKGAAC
jgi:hypothetical protein